MTIEGGNDMKKKNAVLLIVFGILLVAGLIVFGILKDGKIFAKNEGTFSEAELSMMNKRIRKVMHQDVNNQSYYGGCYYEQGNLYILVTKEYKNAMPEVKEAIEKEEGVILRKVKYRLWELEELCDEITQKRMELERTENERTRGFLEDVNTWGVDEIENRVHVGMKDLNLWKQMRFRILFGLVGDHRIEFESGEAVVD